MAARLCLLLAFAFLAAGCASAPAREADAGPEAAVLEDSLAAYRSGSRLSNMEELARFGGTSAELDAWGHYLFADEGSRLVIYDVQDPAAPMQVGEVNGLPGVLDAKVSDDGDWLFVGEDAEASAAPLGGTGPFTGGFYVVDVSDKSHPKPVSYLPVGPRRGPHMVFYHQTAAGDELVFGANADISINRFDRSTGTLTEISRYQADLVTAFNRDPQVFDALYQGWAHDMFVMEDPRDGRTLLYVANWDAGLRIVDVSDPARPVELGGWNAFPEGHEGNLHTVSTEWVGDRRITLGSVEVGFAVVGGYHYALGTDRSILYVWDTTDPADVRLLGTWENPDGAPSGRDMVPGESVTSTHNVQLEQGRAYLAHYGLGVFVLDVSTPEAQASPRLLGHHRDLGSVWDVVVADGVLYASGSAGTVALRFSLDTVGPDGIDSRA